MIFVLTERIMNGTVTMGVITTGIEADTFEGAINKVKGFQNFSSAIINEEAEHMFTYHINNDSGFPVYGLLDDKPLKII
jgi:hypothetical protein